MADSPYQALYRRYRSQRFDEVLGQDHITRALRNAVRDGRVGHAYLFSGPRGTGKTSTARILAKVLNCANPQDGEPDGVCDNCRAVERGLVTDWLLEQDAASKSKVDDMRDLLDRVPLGTSGNRKVIILDEVHMLSQGAENALLKTLEEPPAHVVFVLATTDPQKVRPTIRSRTQHFEFRLLPPDVMADHIRHVIDDAGLALDDEAIAHVVRVGGGSARDTLSALEQVAALGEVVADAQPVDTILDAVVARDAGAVLVAVADAAATGRDMRGLGEALIARLRDAFLALMGAADRHLASSEHDRARQLGEQMGPAGLTRALEELGDSLVELSRKPDPRVVIEVALIRLVRPEADRSLDAILERLERLERGGGGAGAGTAGSTTTVVAPAPAPAVTAAPTPAEAPAPGPVAESTPASQGAVAVQPDSDDETAPSNPTPPAPPTAGGGGDDADGPASAARAALAASRPGARGRAAPPSPKGPRSSKAAGSSADPAGSTSAAAAAATTSASAPPQPASPVPPSSATSGPPDAGEAVPAPPGSGDVEVPAPGPSPAAGGGAVDLDTLTKVWTTQVLAELPIPVRSKWRTGRWLEHEGGGPVRFGVPNAWHQKACEEGRRDVEQALAGQLGPGLRVEVVVDGDVTKGTGDVTGGTGTGPSGARADDDLADLGNIADLPDADDAVTGSVELLMREFGGGDVIQEEPPS